MRQKKTEVSNTGLHRPVDSSGEGTREAVINVASPQVSRQNHGAVDESLFASQKWLWPPILISPHASGGYHGQQPGPAGQGAHDLEGQGFLVFILWCLGSVCNRGMSKELASRWGI